MFDIGWSELLVIAIVAIVVVGPKELPRVLRTFGTYAGKLKRTASEFRRQFDAAMLESELNDMRQSFERTAKEAEAKLKASPVAEEPAMLPKSPSPSKSPSPARDELPGPAVALPGAPVKKSAAKPKAKRATPAKQAKTHGAKTKAEPAP
jgi:sec-independent protein translocase protein TatB